MLIVDDTESQRQYWDSVQSKELRWGEADEWGKKHVSSITLCIHIHTTLLQLKGTAAYTNSTVYFD